MTAWAIWILVNPTCFCVYWWKYQKNYSRPHWHIWITRRTRPIVFDSSSNIFIPPNTNVFHNSKGTYIEPSEKPHAVSGLILSLRPAIEWRRYLVMTSLIDWAQTRINLNMAYCAASREIVMQGNQCMHVNALCQDLKGATYATLNGKFCRIIWFVWCLLFH